MNIAYTPRRIDVHHHFMPPEFLADLKRRGVAWTGGPEVPNWSVDIGREVMARNGIDVAVGSVVPHVNWGDDQAAIRWARHGNEFGARIVQDDPAHFGMFATLPMPDVAASLKELAYAYDVLKADGVILMASVNNQYLGDPAFEELYQELDRRKAIVFIHPNTIPPGATVPRLSIPWGLVEFMADTSRAVTNLLFNGVFERYPSIRWIVAHAGAMIPYIALRLRIGELLPGMSANVPKGTAHYLQRLYYDTALSTSEQVFAAMREFAPSSQLLFGSDYPMVHEGAVKIEVAGLEGSRVLNDATRKAIDRDNALALIPRFATDGARAAA